MKTDRITNKVYIVSGTSSGIGKRIAEFLTKNGAVVYGFSRRTTDNFKTEKGRFISMSVDICEDESVNDAVRNVLETEGNIFGLINCAGSGIAGALETQSAEEVLSQLNINTVGALRLTNAVLPNMRKNNSGVVINIGSIGGIFPLPYQGAYSMSKAALRKQTEVYRMELKPFGVEFGIIEPGDLKTGFTQARKLSSKTIGSVYEKSTDKAVSQMEKNELNGKDPDCVVRMLEKILAKKHIPAAVSAGGIYRVFPFLNRLLPYRMVEFIITKMYS